MYKKTVASLSIVSFTTMMACGQAPLNSQSDLHSTRAAIASASISGFASKLNVDRHLTSAHINPSLVSLHDENNQPSFGFALPAAVADRQGVLNKEGVIYTHSEENADYALQREDEGRARALIIVKDSQASSQYEFPLDLGAQMRAELQSDGSVSIFDSTGDLVGGFEKPWAVDAAGNRVATHFELVDGKLIQHIDLTSVKQFPVVADPSGWGWVSCSLAIGKAIAGNAVLASKIAKVGGVAKAISKLKKAKNADGRKKALVEILGALTGLDDVYNKCIK